MSHSAQRAAMVESQLMVNDVTDPPLLKAMAEIPKERFVPAALESVAYMDGPIPLKAGRTILDARCFGKLVQLAAVKPGDRVLDVACGTGYSTAVLARLAAHVAGLEDDAALAEAARTALGALGIENAEIVRGVLSEGLQSRAPFDAIIVNGAVERDPETLLPQLAPGGRLVCVKRQGPAGQGTLYLKSGGPIGERAAFGAQAPILAGFGRAMGFIL